jgi:hypothetical protein
MHASVPPRSTPIARDSTNATRDKGGGVEMDLAGGSAAAGQDPLGTLLGSSCTRLGSSHTRRAGDAL